MTTLIERNDAVEIVPSSEDWAFAHISKFILGLNKAARPDELQQFQLLMAEGIRPEKDSVILDQGIKAFGQTLQGVPRGTFKFTRKTGAEHFLLFTEKTAYDWQTSPTPSEWQLVPTAVSTTTSGVEAAGQTAIEVVSGAGFVAGRVIGLALTDGKQHVTTIVSVVVNTINITDAIPAPGTASGATVNQGENFTMAATDNFSMDPYPASDWLLVTNGVDNIKKYDGTIIADLNHNLGVSFTAKIVRVFNNIAVFCNTIEGGVKHPQRVRNSAVANPEELLTGNAGFTDLFDEPSVIAGAERLGPFLVIYKNSIIYTCEFVGDATRLFRFQDRVNGVGIPNPNAVTIVEDVHVIFANDNIYQYNGSFDVQPLGDAIFELLFDHVSDMNRNKLNSVFITYIAELKEIWAFYPTSDDALPTSMIRIARLGGGWFTRKYPISIAGFGFFAFGETVKGWDDLVGSWLDQQGSWLGNPARQDNPTVQLMGSTPNQVYEYDYVEPQDNGSDIAYEIETKDFYIPNRNIRLDRVDVSIKGSAIDAFVSVDRGTNWISLGTINPGAVFKSTQLHKQVVGRRLRFKFMGAGDGFGLEDLGFKYKQETIY